MRLRRWLYMYRRPELFTLRRRTPFLRPVLPGNITRAMAGAGTIRNAAGTVDGDNGR